MPAMNRLGGKSGIPGGRRTRTLGAEQVLIETGNFRPVRRYLAPSGFRQDVDQGNWGHGLRGRNSNPVYPWVASRNVPAWD